MRTTIQLDSKTVERLKGKKIIDQESYDHMLNRLLDQLDGAKV